MQVRRGNEPVRLLTTSIPTRPLPWFPLLDEVTLQPCPSIAPAEPYFAELGSCVARQRWAMC